MLSKKSPTEGSRGAPPAMQPKNSPPNLSCTGLNNFFFILTGKIFAIFKLKLKMDLIIAGFLLISASIEDFRSFKNAGTVIINLIFFSVITSKISLGLRLWV